MSLQAAAAAAAADVQNRPSRIPNPNRMITQGGPPRQRFFVHRDKICPLLLRVFPKHGGHHAVEEYSVRGQEPKDEVQIYTWKDATLRELTELVKEVAPEARRRDARLSFAFIYPNRQGNNIFRVVGSTFSSQSRTTTDDEKTLHELGFQTGDFLDLAILS